MLVYYKYFKHIYTYNFPTIPSFEADNGMAITVSKYTLLLSVTYLTWEHEVAFFACHMYNIGHGIYPAYDMTLLTAWVTVS